MKKTFQTFIAVTLVSISAASAQSTVFKTINETEMNLSWVFVSGAAGFNPTVADLSADFTSLNSVTLSPTVRATNTTWYNPVGGGDGSLGLRTLTSYLYGSAPNLNQTYSQIEFAGNVTDFNLGTNAAGTPYTLSAVIRDYVTTNPSSVVQTVLPITTSGSFSVVHNFEFGTNRSVQWGLQLIGPNIWPTDEAQFATAGSVTVVPEPTTYALLGLAAVSGLIARRLRRKA
jgi:hypothetical protein